jgi:hypothetical protein
MPNTRNKQIKGEKNMKNANKLFGLIAIAIIAIIALPLASCKDEPTDGTEEQPQKQPDTPRILSFGTAENPCTVTIKSDDSFTADEWKTLCDKVVAAIERGYDNMFAFAQPDTVTYFANNTVTLILLKSATYDIKVESGDPKPNIVYFKANASAIDEIPANVMTSAINSIRGSGGFYYPTP